jgi:hypothetical protein
MPIDPETISWLSRRNYQILPIFMENPDYPKEIFG